MTHARFGAGTVTVAVVTWLVVGCSSSDDDKKSAAPTAPPKCVDLGDECGPRGSACCQLDDDSSRVQCLDGLCGICKPLQAECSGIECCDGAPCRGGKCCSIGGCSADEDCCGGMVCGGAAGCCIPAGVDTSYTPDCCSGRAKDKYCKYPNPDDGTYYCGTECL
jgi:hypothetical protein